MPPAVEVGGDPEVQAHGAEGRDAGKQLLDEAVGLVARQSSRRGANPQQQGHQHHKQDRSQGDPHGPKHRAIRDLAAVQQHVLAPLQGGAGRPHQDGKRGGFDSPTGAAGTGADKHQHDHQDQPCIRDCRGRHGNGVETSRAGCDRLEEGDLELLPEAVGGHRARVKAEVLGHQQAQGPHHDQQRGGAEHDAGVQGQPPPPETVGGKVAGHAPTDAANHDHGSDHATDDAVVAIGLEVLGPKAKAGIVVGTNHVEHRGPEPTSRVLNIGEAKDVEHHGAKAHHAGRREQDPVKGGAHAANPKLIEGAPLVQPPPQA